MISLIILAVCLVIGIALRHVKSIPENAPSTLGALILYVPLPAVCLLTLPDLEWELSLISLTMVTWIVFGLAYFIFYYLGKKFMWDKKLVGCLILTAGFCNTAFVGFPIIEALYGKEALKHAIFLDQSGSFLIVSSLGIWIALTYSSGRMRKRVLVKKIIFFPPFISFLAGILASVYGWRPDGLTREVLERLSLLLTPMALISVGLQLKWGEIRHDFRYLSLGLFFKLIVAPLIIFIIYHFLGIDKNIRNIAVMESGMATMITSSILASSYGLHPRLAGMMVGVGVPLSFLTLSFWYWILNLTP